MALPTDAMDALMTLTALLRWIRRRHVRGAAGIERLQRHVTSLISYLERNQAALVALLHGSGW